ncbi:hypothetical protein ACFQ0M_10100 [Kitasatospora aburaviensis]
MLRLLPDPHNGPGQSLALTDHVLDLLLGRPAAQHPWLRTAAPGPVPGEAEEPGTPAPPWERWPAPPPAWSAPAPGGTARPTTAWSPACTAHPTPNCATPHTGSRRCWASVWSCSTSPPSTASSVRRPTP